VTIISILAGIVAYGTVPASRESAAEGHVAISRLRERAVESGRDTSVVLHLKGRAEQVTVLRDGRVIVSVRPQNGPFAVAVPDA
jgi:hypothetical protein